MISLVAVMLAAAAVGSLHMAAPDHWLTLIVLGKASGWSRAKLLEVGLITGLGHVLTSIVLGLAIVFLGSYLSTAYFAYFTQGIGLLMMVAGLLYALRAWTRPIGFDHSHHLKDQFLNKGVNSLAVLGAALSPDLTILPIFLVAIPAGIHYAVYAGLAFALASLATLSILLMAGHAGFSKALERLPPKYNDVLAGLVIAAVGVYVLLFG